MGYTDIGDKGLDKLSLRNPAELAAIEAPVDRGYPKAASRIA